MSNATDLPDGSPESNQLQSSAEVLANELEKTGLQEHSDDSDQPEDAQPPNDAVTPPTRPLIVYTRKQLLNLSQSTLVKPPAGMPEFKNWFGELNEQALHNLKKESEAANGSGSARDRRFRRDPEDGEGLSRPPFRSALSQPSQMGNFKHQPLRSNDRDRDAERDLRTLSDRFDRERNRGERIGLTAHSTLLRNRDRDSAPHLLSDRDQQRTRKRNGEEKDDWRRGSDAPRSSREDPHSRRDRDDREPRAREGSRHRDSPPSTRRDRDDHRRDRDRERFVEGDEDGRRWRDDGKRDERLAARRDKDRPADKDKGRDRSREPADNDRDSRDGWSLAEEKGGRRNGRDRDDKREREREKEPAWMETYVPPPSSGGILGGKGTEGEIDSIQEWKLSMKRAERKALGLPETEAPTPARTPASKLDEKVTDAANAPETLADGDASREQNKAQETGDHLQHTGSTPTGDSQNSKPQAIMSEGPLDEIQLFKLMIKQEEKKRAVSGESASERASLPGEVKVNGESAKPGLMRIREGRPPSAIASGEPQNGPTSLTDIAPILSEPMIVPKSQSAMNNVLGGAPSPSNGLAFNNQSLGNIAGSSALSVSDANGSRLITSKTADSILLNDNYGHTKDASQQPQFDPPRQSRLLAFGAQARSPAQPTPQSASAVAQMNHLQQQLDPTWPGQRRPSVSPVMQQQSNVQQPGLDRVNASANQYDINVMESIQRRGTASQGLIYDNRLQDMEAMSREFGRGSISADRAALLAQAEALQQLNDNRRHPTPPNTSFNATSPVSPFDNQLIGNQSSYSSGKGSRMAKHFERARDPSQGQGVNRMNNAVLGANGGVTARQEAQLANHALGPPENRNIQDLLTMLNNSAQSQRAQHIGINQGLGVQQSVQPSLVGHSGLGRIDLNDPDEGRFAPDGLVPGLRPAPSASQRNRDIGGGNMFPGQMVDDTLAFNPRLGVSQQRGGLDQLYSGPIPGQYNGQTPNIARNGLGFQQQAMRGGPSPINNFNPLQGQQQRLPPGLANLGGRPPLEPSQFLGGGVGAGNFGVPNQLHAALQGGNGSQSFNQFQGGGLNGLVGNPTTIRGQQGPGQLGIPLNGLNGGDYRGAPAGAQNQLLGLGGPNLGPAMRGGSGIPPQQLHGPNQLPPNMALRQQQGIQPQLMPQMISAQLQQHGMQGGQPNPADLMALLMGSAHRE